MSEKKYTPGPWHVVKNYDEDFVGVGKTVPWTCLGIADMFDNGDGIETREANACLIACAPELLEMHEKARNTIASFPRSLAYDIPDLPEIDALIAKAKGETK